MNLYKWERSKYILKRVDSNQECMGEEKDLLNKKKMRK